MYWKVPTIMPAAVSGVLIVGERLSITDPIGPAGSGVARTAPRAKRSGR